MHFQIDVTPPNQATPSPGDGPGAVPELLRQLLDVQREQTALLRMLVSAHDVGGRWRALAARFQQDFPGLPVDCKHVLPALERAYVEMIADLTERLRREDDVLENEFAVADFLDRFGPRLGQLATLLSAVGPLAEAPQ